MDKEKEYEALRKKAKSLRYKKPIAKDMNLWLINQEVEEMSEACSEVQWFIDNDENLVSALDGDEDDAFEFRMAFTDLNAELQKFYETLNYDAWVPDCFDELFPASGCGDAFGGYSGYDEYEGDYFGLEPFEYGVAEKEAEKRILRLTKKELLEAVGACLRIYSQFVGLKYRYDCLSASLDILREKNVRILQLVKAIEEQYEKAEESSEHFKYAWGQDIRDLDRMLLEVPQDFWVQ